VYDASTSSLNSARATFCTSSSVSSFDEAQHLMASPVERHRRLGTRAASVDSTVTCGLPAPFTFRDPPEPCTPRSYAADLHIVGAGVDGVDATSSGPAVGALITPRAFQPQSRTPRYAAGAREHARTGDGAVPVVAAASP
jgi:hypothetical protein